MHEDFKRRIIAKHKYRPMFPRLAERETRTLPKSGAVETFKHPGDLILSGSYPILEATEFHW